jgi:hypothetical protein
MSALELDLQTAIKYLRRATRRTEDEKVLAQITAATEHAKEATNGCLDLVAVESVRETDASTQIILCHDRTIRRATR